MKRNSLKARIASFLLAILPLALFAQGTAFTYQGRLMAGNSPANGSYDIQFNLYQASVFGNLVARPVTNLAVAVSNGLFTTTVDFGNAFTGADSWLEISVSTNSANNFTTLTPRRNSHRRPVASLPAQLAI